MRTPRARGRILACALAMISLAARADTPDGGLIDPSYLEIPPTYSAEQGERLRRAVRLEASGATALAEELYTELRREAPDVSLPYALAARALFGEAERSPSSDEAQRIDLLERSLAWAAAGQSADPECALCLLYHSAALGRLATIYGPLWGARHVKHMLELLDLGIALAPRHWEGPHSSTLGNLHFARAVVMRTLPEWFWLRWVLGVRGDIDQALRDIEQARAIHPERLDYLVEHGIILLCRGSRRDDPDSAELGLDTLALALARPAVSAPDQKDRVMALALREEPARACEVTRDGFMDMEEGKLRDGA